MGFDYRPFVITTKNTAGTWGPTYTVWPKIISPPWVENIAPTAPSFNAAGQVSLTFTGRDDNAVQSVFAWVDRDGNGRFDAGEAFQQNAVRLSYTGGTSSWRATIDLAGLNYTSGTYRVYLIATDFQATTSAAAFATVALT
jgi:hypothetical protein